MSILQSLFVYWFGEKFLVSRREAAIETGLVEISSIISAEDRQALIDMGLNFSEPNGWFPFEYVRRELKGAYLQKVLLPEGWHKRRLDGIDYFWGIFDEHGRERARMFHQQTWWCARVVGISVHARYKIFHEAYGPSRRQAWSVLDSVGRVHGETLFTSSDYRCYTTDDFSSDDGATNGNVYRRVREADIAECDRAKAECEAWLNTMFPEWRNKAAYWN